MNSKLVVIDIETTGLDPYKDEITIVGFYDGTDYISVTTKEEYKDVASRFAAHVWCGHNFAFDKRFLYIKGWDKEILSRPFEDTQLMAHTSVKKVPATYIEKYENLRKEKNKELPHGYSHRQASPLSLKVLAPFFLKVAPFWENPVNHNDIEYNKKDCVYTFRLYQFFSKELQNCGQKFYETRMKPWSKMLLDMTIRGVEISSSKIAQLELKLNATMEENLSKLQLEWADATKAYHEKEIEKLKLKYSEMEEKALLKAKDPVKTKARYQKLFEEACSRIEPMNIDSPAQIAWLLKDYLGLDISKIDDESEDSTGKAVLTRLVGEGVSSLSTYLKYRESKKILTAFLPSYKELAVDGVLHPTFNLTGTRTGRTSSSGPNFQQIPSSLYPLFSPGQGKKFLVYDLSGIEAALIAAYTSDMSLYNILDQNISIHDYNAKILFDLDDDVSEIKKKYPKQRQTAKNLGFATFYGAGWRRLQIVFNSGGFQITEKEAKQKLKALKDAYPDVFLFHQEITEIFESGEVVNNLFGRPLVIPDPADAYMKGFNTLIQSSASDLNLKACEMAVEKWMNLGLNAHPVAVIHDCIMAVVSDKDATEAEKILVDSMTQFNIKSHIGDIKIRAEGGVSDEWQK